MSETQPASAPSLETYLQTKVTPRFGEQMRAAEQRLAEAQREVDDLRAASGTIAWQITGPSPAVAYVNIADGEMRVAEQPQAEPFMTISQSAADWERFTTGALPMMGGTTRRPFGRARIDRVRALKGGIRFVLTELPDGASWTCTLYFGTGSRPAEPQTTVTISADLVDKIQSGQVQPQIAFMQGLIRITGDPALAMQLGMALFM